MMIGETNLNLIDMQEIINKSDVKDSFQIDVIATNGLMEN